MADTVADINVDVRGVLNDSQGLILTDSFLLPLINVAYRELQSSIRLNGISYIKETSGLIPVIAGANIIGIADLISPIELGERTPGSTESYIPMAKVEWEFDDIPLTNELRFWAWRENTIRLLGANVDREVKVKYYKGLAALTNNSSVIEISDARPWLSAKVAQSSCYALGANERAELMDEKIEILFNTFIANAVKESQSLGVRKKPFRRRDLVSHLR